MYNIGYDGAVNFNKKQRSSKVTPLRTVYLRNRESHQRNSLGIQASYFHLHNITNKSYCKGFENIPEYNSSISSAILPGLARHEPRSSKVTRKLT